METTSAPDLGSSGGTTGVQVVPQHSAPSFVGCTAMLPAPPGRQWVILMSREWVELNLKYPWQCEREITFRHYFGKILVPILETGEAEACVYGVLPSERW